MDVFENGKMKKTPSGRIQLCFITGKKKKKKKNRPENPPIIESLTKQKDVTLLLTNLPFITKRFL